MELWLPGRKVLADKPSFIETAIALTSAYAGFINTPLPPNLLLSQYSVLELDEFLDEICRRLVSFEPGARKKCRKLPPQAAGAGGCASNASQQEIYNLLLLVHHLNQFLGSR